MRDVIIVRSIICSTSVLFFFNGDKFKTYATFFSQPCNERGIACIIICAVTIFPGRASIQRRNNTATGGELPK